MKNSRLIQVTFLFIFLVSYNSELAAQQTHKLSDNLCMPYKWEVGLPVGMIQYFGDMHCSKAYLSELRPVVGASVRMYLNKYAAIRGQLLIGGIGANDFDQPEGRWDYRGLKFSSPLAEFAVSGELYPFKERKYSAKEVFKNITSPYIYGGTGGVFTNPTVSVQKRDGVKFPPLQRLLDDDEANLKRVAVVIPFGMGVKYNFEERWSIGLELGYRYTFSDYLDGTSLSTTSLVTNVPKKDGYMAGNFLVSYRFNTKDADDDGIPDKCDECPRLKGPKLLMGCPDSDGDGIVDKADICPDDFGDAATCGCPDDDNDGVPNSCDCCPNEKGSRETHGCNEKNVMHTNHKKVTSAQKLCSLCPDILPLAIRR